MKRTIQTVMGYDFACPWSKQFLPCCLDFSYQKKANGIGPKSAGTSARLIQKDHPTEELPERSFSSAVMSRNLLQRQSKTWTARLHWLEWHDSLIVSWLTISTCFILFLYEVKECIVLMLLSVRSKKLLYITQAD